MPDCFISYASADEDIAKHVHSILTSNQVSVFLAPLSLRPGDRWGDEIKAQLEQSSWVVFLASEAACRSPYAQQEIGMALGLRKKLVPVVWDMQPSQLPGWLKEVQALDLRGLTIDNANRRIAAIAKGIHDERVKILLLIAAALIFALVALAYVSRE
jgi:hypothetical protein